MSIFYETRRGGGYRVGNGEGICSCCGSCVAPNIETFNEVNKGYTVMTNVTDEDFAKVVRDSTTYEIDFIKLPNGDNLLVKINIDTDVPHKPEDEDEDY